MRMGEYAVDEYRGTGLLQVIAILIILGLLSVVAIPRYIETRENRQREVQEAEAHGYIRALHNVLTLNTANHYLRGEEWVEDGEELMGLLKRAGSCLMVCAMGITSGPTKERASCGNSKRRPTDCLPRSGESNRGPPRRPGIWSRSIKPRKHPLQNPEPYNQKESDRRISFTGRVLQWSRPSCVDSPASPPYTFDRIYKCVHCFALRRDDIYLVEAKVDGF